MGACEPPTCCERSTSFVRRTASARCARRPPVTELAELLRELAGGTPYERTLGVTIAQVTGEVGYVTRLLNDPTPAVQHRALAAVDKGVPVSDDESSCAATRIPTYGRKRSS